jgi:DNA-binding MarR family transcriptional regulator
MTEFSRADSLAAVEHELRQMHRQIKRTISAHAATVHPELMPASYLVLSWIAENGPARGSAVVEQFNIDKGAVSRQIQHLVDLGLVVRTPDPADGRAQLLSVTETGAQRLEQAQAVRRRHWSEQLSGWTEEDLAAFSRQLARFNADTADT